MHKPNTFIVGAPKCGTTALSTYLASNKDIFLCPNKEPHFFNTDLKYGMCKPKKTHNLSDYTDLFQETKNEISIIDASVWYLYSETAISNILDYAPNAKIIIMLRNPIDMAISLHQQLYFNGEETENDFEKAYKMQSDREAGRKIPKKCSEPRLLLYKKTCALGTQTQRALNLIPPDQVKVILFDDFIKDTQKIYENVLDFLGVPQDGKNDFPKINPATTVHSTLIRDLRFYTPSFIKKILFTIKRTLGIKELGIDRKLMQINTKLVTQKPKISKQFYQKLYGDFESEINLLENVLNRELPEWKTARY